MTSAVSRSVGKCTHFVLQVGKDLLYDTSREILIFIPKYVLLNTLRPRYPAAGYRNLKKLVSLSSQIKYPDSFYTDRILNLAGYRV